ncbi:MAG: hypothetical protein Q9159_000803 [Coniocarpon cinnabarinum]
MSLEAQQPATRKLRLRPLKVSDLPSHPSLASLQSNSNVGLRDFVREVLTEAVDFSDNVIPSTFQKKGSERKSPPSTAKVQVLSSELLRGEAWFARQSVHENAPLDGTASWDEFEAGLFDDHAENEATYTPSIYDTHKVLDWAEQINEIEGDFGVEYEEVAMEIYEMCHELPGPLQNRVFCVLNTRAFTRAGAFVVTQIPVDLKKVPNAIYANGQNRTQGSNELKRAKATIGEYVSVERVHEQDDGNVMWEMATASDAKGWVPMSAQKMGVPGAIVKDVGLFMKQAAEKRTKKPHGAVEELAKPDEVAGEPGPVEEASSQDRVPNPIVDTAQPSYEPLSAVADEEKEQESPNTGADSAYALTPRPDTAESLSAKEEHKQPNGLDAAPQATASA